MICSSRVKLELTRNSLESTPYDTHTSHICLQLCSFSAQTSKLLLSSVPSLEHKFLLKNFCFQPISEITRRFCFDFKIYYFVPLQIVDRSSYVGQSFYVVVLSDLLKAIRMTNVSKSKIYAQNFLKFLIFMTDLINFHNYFN